MNRVFLAIHGVYVAVFSIRMLGETLKSPIHAFKCREGAHVFLPLDPRFISRVTSIPSIDHNPIPFHIIEDPACTAEGFRENEFMQTLSAVAPFRLRPTPHSLLRPLRS